jgi:hypothetical protein
MSNLAAMRAKSFEGCGGHYQPLVLQKIEIPWRTDALVTLQISRTLHNAGAKAIDQRIDRNLEPTRAVVRSGHEIELS